MIQKTHTIHVLNRLPAEAEIREQVVFDYKALRKDYL